MINFSQNQDSIIIMPKKRNNKQISDNRKDTTPIEGKNNYQIRINAINLERTNVPLTPNTKTKYVTHKNAEKIDNKENETHNTANICGKNNPDKTNLDISTTYSQRGRKIKPNQKYNLTDWSK